MLKKLLPILLLCSATFAQSISPADQSFIDKHLSDIVTLTPKKLSDPAITKTFAPPLFNITITINSGDGSNSTQDQVVAQLDNKLVPLARPSTDQDCPDILKMINPSFTLTTDADAKNLQTALNALYPIISDDDKKAATFRHVNHEWQFLRGNFFDKKLGFVFTTNDAGKITAVSFNLKLP